MSCHLWTTWIYKLRFASYCQDPVLDVNLFGWISDKEDGCSYISGISGDTSDLDLDDMDEDEEKEDEPHYPDTADDQDSEARGCATPTQNRRRVSAKKESIGHSPRMRASSTRTSTRSSGRNDRHRKSNADMELICALCQTTSSQAYIIKAFRRVDRSKRIT